MSFTIIKHGFFDTVQDMGRFGFARWGINPGGVMDSYASGVSNSLAGNGAYNPVLEMHFPASEIHFTENALIALTGADFAPFINNVPVPLWKPVLVPGDSVLTFKRKLWGERCYLAVNGTWHVDSWLGSAGTNIRVHAGGLNGRPVKKNDKILISGSPFPKKNLEAVKPLPWNVNPGAVYHRSDEVCFVQGPEWSWLDHSSHVKLFESEFRIDAGSDRMGYRLSHYPLTFENSGALVSSGVTFGTIQATPDGSTIILMADHQTTGGYPRIGYVAGAHLPKLGQLGPGSVFRFHDTKTDDAEKMLISLRQDMSKIQRSCSEKLTQYNAGN